MSLFRSEVRAERKPSKGLLRNFNSKGDEKGGERIIAGIDSSLRRVESMDGLAIRHKL